MRAAPLFVAAALLLALACPVAARGQEPGKHCNTGEIGCCGGDKECDDGNKCNGSETCERLTGTCLPGVPPQCVAATPCTVAQCDPATGCTASPAPDDTTCDDGDACTQNDRCAAGSCTGDPVSCDDGDPCSADACVAGVGCTHVPVVGCLACTSAAACDDGNSCTVDDCSGGVCTHVTASDDAPCDDRNACTEHDVCRAGVCAGTQRNCDDANPCTDDACTADAGCSHAPNHAPCDDGDACTTSDRCAAGTCAGTPKVCPAPDSCHAAGVCDRRSGACTTGAAKLDGTQCDDGDACTVEDLCAGGVCAGTPRVCEDDGVPCTVESCVDGVCRHDPADSRCDTGECVMARCQPSSPNADQLGCVSRPAREGDPCTSDGFSCTTDRCIGGACRHTPSDAACGGGDTCLPMTCDPRAGGADLQGCVAQPGKAQDADCEEDGDPCTIDTCSAGSCAHQMVPDLPGCDPVRPVYERASGLATTARDVEQALDAALAADGGGSSAASAARLQRAADALTSSFDAVSLTLAGKTADSGAASGFVSSAAGVSRASDAPTDPGETLASARARIAFVQVRRTPTQVQRFLSQLAIAQQRAILAPATARGLRRSGRALLRGGKALRRDIRRLRDA